LIHTQQKLVKDEIPKTLLSRIAVLERFAKNPDNRRPEDKIAVFDLDNTLLIGDIGDAVFAQLLLDKMPIHFSWRAYRDLIKAKRKREAYERVVTAMAGIPVDTLIETTRRVMNCGLSVLKPEDAEVPVPKPHPRMLALLKLLKSYGYKIYIISATNQYSVRLVAREFFNLPEFRVFGIKPVVRKKQDPHKGEIKVLSETLERPVTVEEGKAELYKKAIGSTPPLIAAGDSTTDIPMLNLTGIPGLVIWVGTDEKQFGAIQERIKHPENLYFFQR